MAPSTAGSSSPPPPSTTQKADATTKDHPAEEAAASEAAIQAALDCPCVKDLREGPCGEFFKAAFVCFHRSTDIIKGAECFQQNVAFAECLAEHPEVADSMKGGDGSGTAVPELPSEQLRMDIGAGGS